MEQTTLTKRISNTLRAERVIGFIEHLRVPDGTKAGQPLRLDPFQKEIIIEVYTRDDQDKRIVTSSIMSIARKNGKTALVAALILVHLVGPEAVPFGQLYSVAFDRGQASVVFHLARNMVLMDPYLSKRIKITDSSKRLVDPVSGSVFTALSSEVRSHHGKSSSLIIFDELAQFGRDDSMYSVMQTSTGAHEDEALSWVISTQAPDDASLLSQLIDTALIEALPSTRVFLFEVPKEADPFDEANWKLANPALGTFRSLREMREFAEKARRLPSLMPKFRNLYLNQRVSAVDVFIPADVWKANNLEPNYETGRVAFGGLDLSAVRDLTAFVLVIPEDDGTYSVLPRVWKPADLLEEHERIDKVPYTLWADQGFLIPTPGKTIDYRYVAQELGDLAADFDIDTIGFDRWRIEEMRRALDEEGVQLTLEPVGQGFKDMNRCVELLEQVALNEQLRHGNHPILTWCISNTVIDMDTAGARKFAKNKSRSRIDPVVALGMALKMALGEESRTKYHDSELLIL